MENVEKIIEEIIDHGPIEMAHAINIQNANSKIAQKNLVKKIVLISGCIIIGGILIYIILAPTKKATTPEVQNNSNTPL